MYNDRLGRRNYFEKAIWYSSKVYKSNESLLSVNFSQNSVGYIDTLKQPLPKHYRLITQKDIDNNTFPDKVVVLDQVVEIYYTETHEILERVLFKKSKYTGAEKPMFKSDFYSDEELADLNNKQKYPQPQGIFYCRLYSSYNYGTDAFQDSVQFQTHTVQIETRDILKGIKKNDYVFFRNCWWRCDGVERREISKIRQYSKEIDGIYIISLVR